MIKRVLLFLVLIFAGASGAAPAFAGPFDSWAALVVAGDSRAHSGAPSEVFDNARRDLVTALKGMGFAENHIEQFSARPELDLTTKPLRSDAEQIYLNFNKLTQQAIGGCFIYFTSHGAPLGIIVGELMVPIRTISDIVDRTCSNRPTVIIVSACFSGMFIPVMHADNRMIFTAARPDRTSFGCGEANQYTFFDQCVLESLPKSPDFPALAATTKECVGLREKAEMTEPASEPQLYVGSAIAPLLPTLKISGN
jgi:Peptidase C13 family